MNSEQLIKTIQHINIPDNMQDRLLKNCRARASKKEITSKRNYRATLVITLLIVMCLSLTAYAIVNDIISIRLPKGNDELSTDYIVDYQVDVIKLNDDIQKAIEQYYISFREDYNQSIYFNTYTEASNFLGIILLDNNLFNHIQQDNIALEVYGFNENPDRVKLVSHQIIDELPSDVIVQTEFCITQKGNILSLNAFSTGDNQTQISTYKSSINGLIAQIAMTTNQTYDYKTIDIFFVHKNVRYKITFDTDAKNLKKAMPIIKKIVDGFIV